MPGQSVHSKEQATCTARRDTSDTSAHEPRGTRSYCTSHEACAATARATRHAQLLHKRLAGQACSGLPACGTHLACCAPTLHVVCGTHLACRAPTLHVVHQEKVPRNSCGTTCAMPCGACHGGRGHLSCWISRAHMHFPAFSRICRDSELALHAEIDPEPQALVGATLPAARKHGISWAVQMCATIKKLGLCTP